MEWARDIYDDLDFTVVRRWLDEHPHGKAGGYLPVYAPREVLHATGFLPVGIHGAGDRLEIIRGDAFYQSYICHLPRSVIELAQSGRLDMLSAVLFPSTCDVIRNLSGMWKLLYPDVYVRYIDVPQIPDPVAATVFWAGEVQRLLDDLGEASGHRPSDGDLRHSIALYNETRAMIRTLYALRRDRPWMCPRRNSTSCSGPPRAFRPRSSLPARGSTWPPSRRSGGHATTAAWWSWGRSASSRRWGSSRASSAPAATSWTTTSCSATASSRTTCRRSATRCARWPAPSSATTWRRRCSTKPTRWASAT